MPHQLGTGKGKGRLIPRFVPQLWEAGWLGGAASGWVAAGRQALRLDGLRLRCPVINASHPWGVVELA